MYHQPGALILQTNSCIALDDLGTGDFDLLRLFSLKINDPTVTDKLFMQIERLSKCNLDTLYQMKKRLEELSELMAESYDCCVKSCVAFTGPHVKLKACPRCRKPRYRRNGQPMKTYRYIPLIPQLVAYFLNQELNERMRYRSEGHPKAKAEKDGYMTYLMALIISNFYRRRSPSAATVSVTPTSQILVTLPLDSQPMA